MTGLRVASEPPPVPGGGIAYFKAYDCTDSISGQAGYCYRGVTIDGRQILTFYQDGVLMLIREIFKDRYETIWTNDQFNSI